MPTIEQLEQTIANGDDSVNNVLILKLSGEFELIQGAGAGAVSHLNYITRWGTFDAGNDYVGKDASKDKKHIKKIMDWAEEAWNKYSKNGHTKIQNPTS
ncbi:hypothetical protein Q5741_02715 [Paenibacillus sp. JX-17]|uniref:Uncharacterized protein n=1 Tax=Paenibacillus lacisoli TaxID=3064525 RepID=A0ABT9C7U5_9BACL|nr:hypothetical protein [Paenibacillus sp. JX-17]MDO7905324.1 hypothetical protein [Paenibacillus sp. JX-17]